MPDVQHYVPQSTLRRFCNEDGRLVVFDKQERRTFSTGPRNVAAERGFYDFETPNGRVFSLETFLSNIEAQSSQLLERVLDRQEIGFLGQSERRTLAKFAAVQFVRIRGHRERYKDLSDQLAEKIMQFVPADAEVDPLPESTEEEAKLSSMRFILRSQEELIPHFLSKAWLLFESPTNRRFWISDNPVALHNSIPPPAPFMGNLGLAVRGIEIYLPISPRFGLGFLCPSIASGLLKGHENVTVLRHGLDMELERAELLGHLADGLRYGYPVPAEQENMDLFNSLQVAGSERWIFSDVEEFSLAETILDEHPELDSGPRGHVF